MDGQIGFEVTDKEVMKFVSECNELYEDTIIRTGKLVSALNLIGKNTEIPINDVSCNAREMKFLLLLIIMQFVDFTIDTKKKLTALDAINKKLSAFSLAKADSVMSAFSGYSKEVIEEYELLALISKGGHSLRRVENRMQILAYYVNNFDNRIESSGIIPI